MNYHLHQNGKEVGIFPPEGLRRLRACGELKGDERVRCEGTENWQTVDAVLAADAPKETIPPPLPPPLPVPQRRRNPVVIAVVIIAAVFTLGAVLVFYTVFLPVMKHFQAAPGAGGLGENTRSAEEIAGSPVVWTNRTQNWVQARQAAGEFRMRQYVEEYQLRGDRNPGCDRLALQFLTNWIACNYGGTVDTNLPSLTELGNRLAADPDCQDPLVLTVAAVNAAELHESIRQLERAVKGFETSKHRAYPKFYATLTLAEKLIQDRTDRLPVLDAAALGYLQTAFTDGSLQPGDQAEIASVLLDGWGRDFYNRNTAAVISLAQAQGASFRWLALVLQGQNEITEAWRARGDGYANAVTENGWTGFRTHLAAARKSLTDAWQLQPDLPLAPCLMMTVSLGDSNLAEMRAWLDRTTLAQIDYPAAWKEMRWGLRPRWYGNTDAMLALGVTALNTRRFDTDTPRMLFDSVADLETEAGLPPGQHLYARADIWPHLQAMYEGYIAEPTLSAYDRDGWRSTYAVIAYLAGKYEVARQQLQALHWQPHPGNLTGWNHDLSLLPQEVAARTGAQAADVTAAESLRDTGDLTGALHSYQKLSAAPDADAPTRAFIKDRLVTLGMETRLQAGEWVDYLPADAGFTGWQTGLGKFTLQPDGALEVAAGEYGHLIYCRARLGTEFEVRGEFEVVSTNTQFQAGLVMGIPEWDSYNWYAFRIKRNRDEGDVASFSQHWLKRQILAPATLDRRRNAFTFRFQGGRVTATVNDREVFNRVPPPRNSYVTTNEFVLGVGAFNDSNATVIRYRNLQVHRLAAP